MLQILRKINSFFINKNIENIFVLRKEFKKLPLKISVNSTGAEFFWFKLNNKLADLVENRNPNKFLTWRIIKDTMFAPESNIIDLEYEELLKSPRANYWLSKLIEDPIGSPVRYSKNIQTSSNLIHHVYHLEKFIQAQNADVAGYNFILEFGGGYGSMSRLIHRIGFEGKYVIFDLPAFSLLQKFYLKSLGFNVLEPNEFNGDKSGIILISDFEILGQILSEINSNKSNLFLATWSISETPLKLRGVFSDNISKFNNFLIAFQDSFEEVDNNKYFTELLNNHSNINWTPIKIKHMPGHNYIFGSI